jgi:Fibronectin type III domain
VELRDNANGLVASSDPLTDTGASISATVAAGTYHLMITGVGNAVTPYSDYDSLGQYFINGTITTGVADLTAPTPDPMSWASVPAPTSASTIAMTATTAVDAISSVQYRFNCTSGATGCVASAWQASPSYIASGLAASTQYTFTVQARDFSGNTTAASSAASATTDTPPPPPPFVDYVAASDTPVAGSVNGGFGNTATDNGVVQAITEVESGGKPTSRYSTLEHRWNFNVTAGVGTTVVANAYSGGSADGDTFNFQYSLNGGTSWTTMFNVASTSAGNLQSFAIPGAPGGSILVRVVDSNRTAGARDMNTVSVDHLYIQVANPSSDPPVGNPSGMTATAVSSSQINLAWIDGVSGETNYRVERSPDGVNGWTVVATLALNSQSFSNTGLAASTTYFYRVSAYSALGMSGFASASATTPVAPAISLTAAGSRVKGISKVNLSWSGATGVDIYRNGAIVAPGVGGTTYTDTLGKVTGTYTHKVCVAGSATTCSNTTTTVF